MRSLCVFAMATAFLSTPAQAQTIEQKAQVCGECHGENGVPQQKDRPVIWGQQLGYLFIELRDFKTGARKHDSVSPKTQGLDFADLMPLAQYFSQKAWPKLMQPPATGDVLALAQRINAAVVCTSCHQEGFKGDSVQPRLAGQNHDYLLKTMSDFQSGARANNPGMTGVMKGMSQSDIVALAPFLAGLQLQ